MEASEAPAHGLGAKSRIVTLLVVAVIVALALVALPGIGDIRNRLGNANGGWIAWAAAFSVLSMFGFVRALWAVFDRAVPWRRAVVLGFAEQGANVLMPAGGVSGPALGVLVMRRAGVPGDLAARRHAALFLATSAVSLVALLLAGTLLAVGILPRDVALSAVVAPAGGAAAVLLGSLAVALRRPRASEPHSRIGRALHFIHGGARATLEVLLHGDRLFVLGAVTYFAADVLSLAAAFHAVSAAAPPVGVFVVAYTLGHAGALLPTPGGIGGTEGGLIGAFSAYGASPAAATAAVLLYRVFQLGLPAVLGGLCMLRIRRQLARGSRSPLATEA